MKFAGKVWRLLVGIKDGLVLIFMLLFFAMLYAALSATPQTGVSEGALALRLDGPLVEQPAEADPVALLSGVPMLREVRLRDAIHALEEARSDDRVKAIALDLDMFPGGGQAAVSDLAEAIGEFRKSGKPVIAYATGYSDDAYRLAAQASEVWVNPMGGVLFTGPGGTNLYFKGLLDRIGVTANVYKAGAYKAAVEPFTRSDMSPEAREANQAVASALWETWQDEVRRARPKAQVQAYAAQPLAAMTRSGGDLARAALAAGLVDKIGDRAAFHKRVAELVGTNDEDLPGDYKAIHLDEWVNSNPVPTEGNIGVVTIAGEIVDGKAALGTAGAETIVRNLERGLEKHDLKALVVRVDSPGGSALASERIRQALLAAKARGLPVVVSMGSVAASGGYWVAMAGDRVYAEPETITGSIGVFGILPSFEGTLEKLGIGADGIKTTPLSGEPDLLRGPSDEVDQLLQMGVENTYRRFVALVSSARNMPAQRVDAVGQGRIWDGGTARQLGLVDAFGSLDDAVAEAARRAKIEPGKARPVWLEQEPDLWSQILMSAADTGEQEQTDDVFSRIAQRPQMLLMRALADAERLLDAPAIQARCLECPAARPAPRRASEGQGSWIARLLLR